MSHFTRNMKILPAWTFSFHPSNFDRNPFELLQVQGKPFIQQHDDDTPQTTFWWGWEEQVWGACWQGWGRFQRPKHSISSQDAEQTLHFPECLPAHLTPRSPCLADSLVWLKMTRFRLAGRQLLKRSYVVMAVNEVMFIGQSVFISAKVCMIH